MGGAIGGATAVVGDLAMMISCCLEIPDDITAVTLVALGTSLPDTFASRTAALHDDVADNAIGNVMGSNSVNVFLGLGLPWTIAAFYWETEGVTKEWQDHLYRGKTYADTWGKIHAGGGFLVPAGTLAFSIGVYTATALPCITLLVVRRHV